MKIDVNESVTIFTNKMANEVSIVLADGRTLDVTFEEAVAIVPLLSAAVEAKPSK